VFHGLVCSPGPANVICPRRLLHLFLLVAARVNASWSVRMKAIFAVIMVFFGFGTAQAGQLLNLPCRQFQDGYQSLIDSTWIIVYGGRSGPSLDSRYKNILGYTERISYMTYEKQSWGYCKLMTK